MEEHSFVADVFGALGDCVRVLHGSQQTEPYLIRLGPRLYNVTSLSLRRLTMSEELGRVLGEFLP